MNRKKTKRALLSSALAMILCIAMLIGSTFAWFTDTASTAVNKIQSGTLKVDIVKEDGETSIKNESMSFVNKEGSADILWEPGATFMTPAFKIKSTGKQALKYKLTLNGIIGNNKLLDVIRFSVVKADGSEVDLDTFEGHLTPAAALSEALYIKGYMDKDANNDYQGKTLNGLGIIVVATQDTVENDSYNNEYDTNAEYPTITTSATIEEAFADADFDFGFTNPSTDKVVLDGKGLVTVTGYLDGWFAGDVTIKGVTFKNGVCFTAKNNNTSGTITFEDCTFYACDQRKIDLTHYAVRALDNSGDGLCLNVDTKNSPELKVVVKDCTFIGEDDITLDRNGWKSMGGAGWNYNPALRTKSRGHAVMINGISGGGENARAESVLIEGCTMSGIRGHAIQLHSLRMPVTVKDCKTDSWGKNASTAAGTTTDAAIRGDIINGTDGNLILENNYFGLDESTGILHVKIDNFGANTDGSRNAGTY